MHRFLFCMYKISKPSRKPKQHIISQVPDFVAFPVLEKDEVCYLVQ